MSNAPKWIRDVLAVRVDDDTGLDDLAIAISEEFPVRACMSAAAGSLRAQLVTHGLGAAITEGEIDAIANNMLQAISGAVMGADTEGTHTLDEWIEMRTLLGNIGAPWQIEGRTLRIAEQLNHLIGVRRVGGVLVDHAKLERLRAAHRELWAAYHDGDISDTHYPEEDNEPHAFEPYSADHLASTCRVCAGGIGEHPCTKIRECPEDDTCECNGRKVLTEMQHAIEDIAGKMKP